MKDTYIFLVTLGVMCAVLGAMIQKVITLMVNDPDIRDNLKTLRKYIPKRRVDSRWQ